MDNEQMEYAAGIGRHTEIVTFLFSANRHVLPKTVIIGGMADELNQAHFGLRENAVVFDEGTDTAGPFEVVHISILV